MQVNKIALTSQDYANSHKRRTTIQMPLQSMRRGRDSSRHVHHLTPKRHVQMLMPLQTMQQRGKTKDMFELRCAHEEMIDWFPDLDFLRCCFVRGLCRGHCRRCDLLQGDLWDISIVLSV